MKGIELSITDDGQLAIRCLEHDQTHVAKAQFCCWDVMVRAISMGIRQMPEGYRARALGRPLPTDLTGNLFEIASAPLLAFNPTTKENSPIDKN